MRSWRCRTSDPDCRECRSARGRCRRTSSSPRRACTGPVGAGCTRPDESHRPRRRSGGGEAGWWSASEGSREVVLGALLFLLAQIAQASMEFEGSRDVERETATRRGPVQRQSQVPILRRTPGRLEQRKVHRRRYCVPHGRRRGVLRPQLPQYPRSYTLSPLLDRPVAHEPR